MWSTGLLVTLPHAIPFRAVFTLKGESSLVDCGKTAEIDSVQSYVNIPPSNA
jgi:hypothetical protein